MFIAAALLYPCVLAALCVGAGLLVDRCCGCFLPPSLLLPTGAAALIAVSQLASYPHALAPATPYLVAVVSLTGFVLMRGDTIALARRAWTSPWLSAAMVLAYLVALAPVLISGRATFSSYMTLADSAVHIMGADFLMRHGWDFAHLDLRNSYGQFINNYYNTNYPSGADTLLGASAFLLRLPVIWLFQPFNAFMLAIATGPVWLLARRTGLGRLLSALAALGVSLAALVYGYELIGSVKEIVALSMLLTLGCLVVGHRDWLRASSVRSVVPFAIVLAAGVSSLGVAFGVWALVAAIVLAVILIAEHARSRESPWRSLWFLAAGAIVALVAALPTWIHLSGSLKVAQSIASTSNPGNLHAPLQAIQLFGVWLHGSYKLPPTGADLTITHALIAVTFLAALFGAIHLLRRRAFALAGWIALMLLAWLVVSESTTTWASAKALMLTSPVVSLLAWAGVAALRSRPSWSGPAAALLTLVLLGGVLASDAMQYHDSNLAPTARYEELSSIDSRFAGQGPTLFTDFDEYALYELRDLDVGGPDFAFPPPALAAIAGGYGQPVKLDDASPAALSGYPLIITRRDPTASLPPSPYALVWRGAYYEVWRRRKGAAVPLTHVGLTGVPAVQCLRIGRLASSATARSMRLLAAVAPTLVAVSLEFAEHPGGWRHARQGLVMSGPGVLSAAFDVPHGGVWDVWVKGQIMPTVKLYIDGRALGSIGGQLSGNSLVQSPATPLTVRLAGGQHRLLLIRKDAPLEPGDGGSAVLNSIFLTPADAAQALDVEPVARWRALCGQRYHWVELLPS